MHILWMGFEEGRREYCKLMKVLTSFMVTVTGDASFLDNVVLNTCYTVIKLPDAYSWIPARRQHQKALVLLWLPQDYNNSGSVAQFSPQASLLPHHPSTSTGLLHQLYHWTVLKGRRKQNIFLLQDKRKLPWKHKDWHSMSFLKSNSQWTC